MRLNERLPWASVAAILLGFTLTAPGMAQTSTNRNIANIRIDNFGQVGPVYYREAQPEPRDVADLASLGVKAVIDLTKNGDANDAREEERVERAGMKFYRIPMTTHETPSREKIARFLELVGDVANQPVYVHCEGGRHRTGVMTAVYRMTNDGWTANQAFAEMKRYRFGADFLHSEFKDFVYAYHPALSNHPELSKTSSVQPAGGIVTAIPPAN